MPPMIAIKIYVSNTILMVLFVILSNLEYLYFGDSLFLKTLVSCPVKITTPIMNSVFLTLMPLSTTCSASRGIDFGLYYGALKLPSNLYRYGFGFSHIILPDIFYHCEISYDEKTPCRSFCICLSFKLVSPSRFFVST